MSFDQPVERSDPLRPANQLQNRINGPGGARVASEAVTV